MLVSVRHYLLVCSGGRQAKLPCALMSREPAVSVIQLSSGSDVGHDLLDRATGGAQEGVNHNLSFPVLCGDSQRYRPHVRGAHSPRADPRSAALQSGHRVR